MIFLGFLECLTGIHDFFVLMRPELAMPLVVANAMTTILIATFFEMNHKTDKFHDFGRPKITMTEKQFEALIAKG